MRGLAHPGADLRVVPGVWGHFAGNGSNARDTAFLEAALSDLLRD